MALEVLADLLDGVGRALQLQFGHRDAVDVRVLDHRLELLVREGVEVVREDGLRKAWAGLRRGDPVRRDPVRSRFSHGGSSSFVRGCGVVARRHIWA
ncbi:hypothetical protein [Streptomyces sp. ISL-11]|uniref:hypothetical protein n=1 Tax=Streptomyces sp. ISL-11 TaxID=2819174 RepID=UPI001BED2153|nr:hypothetical protein [Streptomyces sp. ISL-11]MBT2383791.1 hypothetical protein [Streptomyces sp. ISL-11]